MTEHRPRFFRSDAEIEHLGEGLLACTLARADWTHEAHLAATTYLVLRRPDVDLDKELPGIIRRFNESVGGVNDDTQGYHETITRTFLHGVRLFLTGAGTSEALHGLVNELLLSPMGGRDWPLRFYSRERLFSVEARRQFVRPDVAALRERNLRSSWAKSKGAGSTIVRGAYGAPLRTNESCGRYESAHSLVFSRMFSSRMRASTLRVSSGRKLIWCRVPR